MIVNEPTDRQLRKLAKRWIAELSNVAESREQGLNAIAEEFMRSMRQPSVST